MWDYVAPGDMDLQGLALPEELGKKGTGWLYEAEHFTKPYT